MNGHFGKEICPVTQNQKRAAGSGRRRFVSVAGSGTPTPRPRSLSTGTTTNAPFAGLSMEDTVNGPKYTMSTAGEECPGTGENVIQVCSVCAKSATPHLFKISAPLLDSTGWKISWSKPIPIQSINPSKRYPNNRRSFNAA